MKKFTPVVASMLALGWCSMLHAEETGQAPPPPADQVQQDAEQEEAYDPGTIVVTSTRVRGQLLVDQPPIAEYDAEDIAAFGGSSIADIIAAIEPATSSGRGSRGGGRPVFLINGIRVSSWREFRRYPPESVAKVEVFAEEVAQRFGYSADQRVMNIILKDNFGSFTGEIEFEAPDSGGYWRNEQEIGYLKIADGGRMNFNLDIEDISLLTEDERGFTVNSPIEGIADEAPFRSLISDSLEIEASANYARAFIDSGSSISLNTTITRTEGRSLAGLREIEGNVDVLERRRTTDNYQFGTTYSRPIGDFQLTATFDGGRTDSENEIDRRTDSGFDISRSTVWNGQALTTLRGVATEIAAGEVTTTFDFGYGWRRIESEDTRVATSTALTRGDLSGGVNINVPITSTRTGHWDAIGSLSLNGSAGFDHLSDFGTLQDWSIGLNWSPFERLNLQVSRIWREVAPGLSELGDPTVQNFNVPIFDFATGQNVLATTISGGNPNLAAETQADWKFGLNWELPFWDSTRFQVDYAVNTSDDVTLSNPSYSAAFESAFPDRVTRDGAGQLTVIDRRPVTLFETRNRSLSFGLNTNGRVGKAAPRGGGRGGGSGASGRQPASGAPGGGPNRERFQELREQFCATPEGTMPDLSQLPGPMRERLLGADGQPDPEKVAQARQRLCSAESASSGATPSSGARQRGGMNPFSRGGSSQGRYFLNINHSIVLENEILLSPGGPLFDQIDGDVIGGGAVSRHRTRLEGGLFWGGYGVRLSGRYEGKAVVNGSALPGSSDLFYGDLAVFDLRLFANLGEIFDEPETWMKGMRLAFVIDNVFDGKRRVVDADGNVPDAFDPRRLDPVGRYLGIDLRKQF